jgi:hypothetical protein
VWSMDAVEGDGSGVFPLHFQRVYHYYSTRLIIFVENGDEEHCDCAKWQKFVNHWIFAY